ncbi:hypothetical protein KKA53_01705 [Candidatus Dependentiae bacterium]|nr:hypothetical protein [Candidatus Dependentiae bacterium]
MKKKAFLAIMILVSVTGLRGQASRTLESIQNECLEIVDSNKKMEDTISNKCNELAKHENPLQAAGNKIVRGVVAQMGRKSEESNLSSLGVGCMADILGDRRAEVFFETANFYRIAAHEKMKNELLSLNVKVIDCFERMFKTKVESIGSLRDDGSEWFCKFQEDFFCVIEKIQNKSVAYLYEAAIEDICLFTTQEIEFNQSSITQEFQECGDNVLYCLIGITDITDPKSYIKKIEEAVNDGVDAMEKEMKERELELLSQKEFDQPNQSTTTPEITMPTYTIGAPAPKEYKFLGPKPGPKEVIIDEPSDDDIRNIEKSVLNWADNVPSSEEDEFIGELMDLSCLSDTSSAEESFSDADEHEQQVNEEIERLEQELSSSESDDEDEEGKELRNRLYQLLTGSVDESEIEKELKSLEKEQQEQVRPNKKKSVRKARKKGGFSERRERLRRINEKNQAQLMRKKIKNIIDIAESLLRVNGKRTNNVEDIKQKLKNPNLSCSDLKALLQDAIKCQKVAGVTDY